MAAHFVPGVTAESLHRLHALWEERVGAVSRPPALPRTDPDLNRRLRVGLVSADLHAHPVGYLLIRAIEARDPTSVEYVAYSGSGADDAIARRFRPAIRTWRDIAEWSDARLASALWLVALTAMTMGAGLLAGRPRFVEDAPIRRIRVAPN